MDSKPISDLCQSEPNDQFEVGDLALGGLVLELFGLIQLFSGVLVQRSLLLVDDLSHESLQLLDELFP